MELTATDLWDRVLESARAGIPEQSYRTWLSGTSASALTDGELLVEAPSQFHVEWIEDKYGSMLGELTRRVMGRPLRIAFRSSKLPAAAPSLTDPVPQETRTNPVQPVSTSGTSQQASSSTPSGRTTSGLKERYTFGRFVVGSNNQLATAACRAVAEKPARMYNPLFLYGGVGLGKTHLMHAIGNYILDQDGPGRVAYISSEQFTNQLVTSIQQGSMAEFRRRYRQMDLLLVDDVHFLEGKERTQEEFFHTFNALYDAQKQIVVTSDRPPKELPGLEERLVSRFEWGLVADIKPPDYETRVAILRKKAADDRIVLDDDVIDYIAHSCTASVRELEGAVIKLLAFSSLTNQEITSSLARTALSGVLRTESLRDRARLTPEVIRDTVARRWKVRPDALVSKRRTKDLTVPRQVAMYLIKEILDTSLVQIGEVFGGRDHSTVIHSIRKIEQDMEVDSVFRREVEEAQAELRYPVNPHI
ncbi:MAG TPA: chromosomal replication initiator protein DnaA [Gemmatimonadetes bacterium]|nr:chromosomal replication initiator protein DnaA [Gemmatimonadota bacterium]|tara:strand:+ start:196 stop:1620 length:1425 start_codon:yes stop_codon:yes gene_type:complete